jgi:hypothetical protein
MNWLLTVDYELSIRLRQHNLPFAQPLSTRFQNNRPKAVTGKLAVLRMLVIHRGVNRKNSFVAIFTNTIRKSFCFFT